MAISRQYYIGVAAVAVFSLTGLGLWWATEDTEEPQPPIDALVLGTTDELEWPERIDGLGKALFSDATRQVSAMVHRGLFRRTIDDATSVVRFELDLLAEYTLDTESTPYKATFKLHPEQTLIMARSSTEVPVTAGLVVDAIRLYSQRGGSLPEDERPRVGEALAKYCLNCDSAGSPTGLEFTCQFKDLGRDTLAAILSFPMVTDVEGALLEGGPYVVMDKDSDSVRLRRRTGAEGVPERVSWLQVPVQANLLVKLARGDILVAPRVPASTESKNLDRRTLPDETMVVALINARALPDRSERLRIARALREAVATSSSEVAWTFFRHDRPWIASEVKRRVANTGDPADPGRTSYPALGRASPCAPVSGIVCSNDEPCCFTWYEVEKGDPPSKVQIAYATTLDVRDFAEGLARSYKWPTPQAFDSSRVRRALTEGGPDVLILPLDDPFFGAALDRYFREVWTGSTPTTARLYKLTETRAKSPEVAEWPMLEAAIHQLVVREGLAIPLFQSQRTVAWVKDRVNLAPEGHESIDGAVPTSDFMEWTYP